MGALFSRVRGGSKAVEGDAELASEVEALSCSVCTPGTPRAAPPLPLSAPALVGASRVRAHRLPSRASRVS